MFEGTKLSPWGKALLLLDICVQGLVALLLLNITLLLAQYVDWVKLFSSYE
jgi:hypothetical protein